MLPKEKERNLEFPRRAGGGQGSTRRKKNDSSGLKVISYGIVEPYYRMKLTGPRLDKRDEYLMLRRMRVLSSDEYQSLLGKLERAEAGVIKRREKAFARAEAARLEKARLRKVEGERKRLARVQKAKDKRQEKMFMKNVVFKGAIGNDADLNTIWRLVRGRQLRFVGEGFDVSLHVSDKSYKEFRNDFTSKVLGQVGSDVSLSVEKLIVLKPTPLSATRILQSFRDGVSHCVFEPIILKLESGLDDASDSTKKRLNQRIAKLKGMAKLWDTGVPEEKMEEVARASGFNIVIRDALGGSVASYYQNGKSIMNFINARENHLDVGGLVLKEEGVVVSADEMMELWDSAKKAWASDKQFYMIDGSLGKGICRRLYTLHGSFITYNADKEFMDAQDAVLDLSKYKLNATKYPDVNKFILDGRIINSWVCNLGDDEATGHVDMPKAYAQFAKCHMYAGFLGMIHQWRSGEFSLEFVKKHIGIYKFRILDGVSPLLSKLGLCEGAEYTLPSVELLYFVSLGCSVSVSAGVWGSRMDFEFLPTMFEDKRYARWSGRLGMEYPKQSYTFPCTSEWASHLKCNYEDVYHWKDLGMASVMIPNESIFTSHHILAFITSYVRIQMMEAMAGFDLGSLVKVVMDGIYFRGAAPSSVDWFVEKELKPHSGGFGWYEPSSVDVSWGSMVCEGNTLLTGQGGSGKTYSIMSDPCYHKPLFVCPQHVLGADVRKKYGVSYTTIHRLIGEGCRPFKEEMYYPPMIFVDEITQIEGAWIDKVFEMYPESLIFLAGDMAGDGQWFQCRGGNGLEYSKLWKPTGVDVVCVAGDRRSRDDALRSLKLQVRSVMEELFVDGDSGEEYLMRDWAVKHLTMVDFFDAVNMFREGDTWIAGTHKTSDTLISLGICSGYYKKGGYVSDIAIDGYSKRGSFTIHSYQGKTIESGKIFISIRDCFEYAMIYTAISRAVSFDQLVFVH